MILGQQLETDPCVGQGGKRVKGEEIDSVRGTSLIWKSPLRGEIHVLFRAVWEILLRLILESVKAKKESCWSSGDSNCMNSNVIRYSSKVGPFVKSLPYLVHWRTDFIDIYPSESPLHGVGTSRGMAIHGLSDL